MSTFCKSTIWVAAVLAMTIGPSFGQSDLGKLIDLIDQDKLSTLADIKQLREKNSQNSRQAAIFDFGYGLSALKFGRAKEAVEVLQPFVDQRPKVLQARLLLMRAYIDLEQFDNLVLQAEKLLQNVPPQASAAQTIAKSTGTLVGFLNFARPDCSDELKKRLEQAAESRIPEEFKKVYRESIALVESRVETINDEIEKAIEKADLETESKVASNLISAEKLRQEAGSQAEELQKREQLRTEKYEELKVKLRNIEQEYTLLTARYVFLSNQIDNFRSERRSLEREETRKDKNGNKTTRPEIINRPRYNQLGTMISDARAEMSSLDSRGGILMNNYQQLRVQAVGLLSQQQIDELFSKDKMKQFGKAAYAKEKKAERESDRKGKGVPALRVLNAKLKNYSTYEPLDVASNKEYLMEIVKKVINPR